MGAEIADRVLIARERAQRAATAPPAVKRSKVRAIMPLLGDSGDDEGIMLVPDIPPRPEGESQEGSTITLAMRPSPGKPRAPLSPTAALSILDPLEEDLVENLAEEDPAVAIPSSTAPPSLAGIKRRRAPTVRYEQARRDGMVKSIGLSQARE